MSGDVARTEGRNQAGGWPPRSPAWWCKYPSRWHSDNDDASEHEVSALAAAFVTALQPDVVVETGTHTGQTARAIGEALTRNGQGMLYTIEVEDCWVAQARPNLAGLPVTVVQADSVQWLASEACPDGIGFAWVDGLWEHRIPDIEALYPRCSPGAIIGIHDTGPHFPHRVDMQLERLAAAGKIRLLSLRTPRGVTFAQVLNDPQEGNA